MPVPRKILEERVDAAILGSTPLDITYEKKNGERVRRRIEPYEIKTEKVLDDYGYMKTVTFLYGYDITKGIPQEKQTIKKWITDKITTMRIADGVSFKPRW